MHAAGDGCPDSSPDKKRQSHGCCSRNNVEILLPRGQLERSIAINGLRRQHRNHVLLSVVVERCSSWSKVVRGDVAQAPGPAVGRIACVSSFGNSNEQQREAQGPLYQDTHHHFIEHRCSSLSQLQLGSCDKPPRGSLTARHHAASHLPARPPGCFHQLHLCDCPHLQAYTQREGMLLFTCR